VKPELLIFLPAPAGFLLGLLIRPRYGVPAVLAGALLAGAAPVVFNSSYPGDPEFLPLEAVVVAVALAVAVEGLAALMIGAGVRHMRERRSSGDSRT